MNPNQKIEICKKVREHAQNSLFKVLQEIMINNLVLSEAEIRDEWLSELQKNKTIFKEGWYSPPPHGIGVLIGTDKDGEKSHLNCKSLRARKMWPQKDIRLSTKNGIIYAYASPIDKKTGVIGDFGITVYFGNKKEIINHLILYYKIARQIFDYIKPGLTFSEVAGYAKDLFTSYGLNNEIECQTNPSVGNNVGHTIPFVMEDLTRQESEILKHENHNELKKIISEKRIFVQFAENQVIENSMAFTIEPRPKVVNNLKIPMVSFHLICAIHENGKKELITNFDKIFDLVGMKYMR